MTRMMKITLRALVAAGLAVGAVLAGAPASAALASASADTCSASASANPAPAPVSADPATGRASALPPAAATSSIEFSGLDIDRQDDSALARMAFAGGVVSAATTSARAANSLTAAGLHVAPRYHDTLGRRGHQRPGWVCQLPVAGRQPALPDSLHLLVTSNHAPVVDNTLADLAAGLRRSGPRRQISVRPGGVLRHAGPGPGCRVGSGLPVRTARRLIGGLSAWCRPASGPLANQR